MRREWLIQLRIDKGFTQEQIATKAFIDRGYYSQLENGKRDPGFNVAVNISKVLEFNPLMFFRDQFTESHSIDPPHKRESIKSLNEIDHGNIIYLYEDSDRYLHQLITFLLIGIEYESTSLIIDDSNTIQYVREKLNKLTRNTKSMKNIHFIENNDTRQLDTVLHKWLDDQRIQVWVQENRVAESDCFKKIKRYVAPKNITMSGANNMLGVCAHNATLVTAQSYIRMMRLFPYLMTDTEIVNSPLFHLNNGNHTLSPSLYVQGDMD
ncbi:helix-turn-helix domain-containing protein [Aquibacillus sediminis]|uniref:helix-turn-helix domain-containing protein n=1 Tax=Aquibacillus sediminis TaxID=2574734 RepID=UPI001485E6E9|nr:helix-turn-helix transcriptional regulator [Aquibacillus sediminis]